MSILAKSEIFEMPGEGFNSTLSALLAYFKSDKLVSDKKDLHLCLELTNLDHKDVEFYFDDTVDLAESIENINVGELAHPSIVITFKHGTYDYCLKLYISLYDGGLIYLDLNIGEKVPTFIKILPNICIYKLSDCLLFINPHDTKCYLNLTLAFNTNSFGNRLTNVISYRKDDKTFLEPQSLRRLLYNEYQLGVLSECIDLKKHKSFVAEPGKHAFRVGVLTGEMSKFCKGADEAALEANKRADDYTAFALKILFDTTVKKEAMNEQQPPTL